MHWRRRAAGVSLIVACAAAAAAQACGSETFQGASDHDASTDGASTGDGGGTSGDAQVGDAGPSSCLTDAPQAYFCVDFDELDPRTAFELGSSVSAFDYPSVTDAGTFTIDGGGESPPNAAEAFLPDLPDGSTEHAVVTATLPIASTVQHYVFHAHVRFDQYGDIGGTGVLALVGLTFKDDTSGAHTDYTVFVSKGSMQLNVAGASTPTTVTMGSLPSPGSGWVPLDIEITPGGVITAQLGTNVKASTTSDLLGTQNHPMISIGVASTFGTPVFGISYDDVALDVQHFDGGVGLFDAG